MSEQYDLQSQYDLYDPESIKLGEIRQGIYFEGEWEAGAIEGDVFNYNGEAAGTLDGLTLTRNDPPGKLTQCQLVRKA